jgi:hypothetical protein
MLKERKDSPPLPPSLPRKLTRHLVAAIVYDTILPLQDPQEIMTGTKPDMKKDLRAPFGTFAVFITPTKTSDEDPRGGDRTRPRT